MPYPVIRRRQARLDIEEAAFWYAAEANEAISGRFVAALETAMQHIATWPESGSLRYAVISPDADLRFWRIRKFPWLIFYRVVDERIDVWRVLHAERDIPEWLRVTE